MRKPIGIAVVLMLVLSGVAFAAPEAESSESPVTITVWHAADEPQQQAIYEEIEREFEAAYPNYSVEVTLLARSDLDNTLPISLGAGVGPDIAAYDAGDANLGALVAAGLVFDMTELYAQQGWDEKVFESMQAPVRYDGKLWGVPVMLEAQGLWYNEVIIDQLGVDPPTTYDNFITVAEAAAAAGIVPISNTGKDQWHVPQLVANIVYGMIPKDVVYDASTLGGSSTWKDDPRFLEAVTIFQEWSRLGWFLPDPLGNDFGEETRVFAAGEAAMTAMGPWMTQFALENAAEGVFEPRFVPMPVQTPGLPLVNHGAAGEALFINAAIDDEKLAAARAYIDFGFVSDDGVLRWFEDMGRMPAASVDADWQSIATNPVILSVVAAHNDVLADGGLGGIWLDQFVSPEASQIFTQGLQEVMVMRKSPADFIEEIYQATLQARASAQ